MTDMTDEDAAVFALVNKGRRLRDVAAALSITVDDVVAVLYRHNVKPVEITEAKGSLGDVRLPPFRDDVDAGQCRKLWAEVCQSEIDMAMKGSPEAIRWARSAHFREVAALAGLDPEAAQVRVLRKLGIPHG